MRVPSGFASDDAQIIIRAEQPMLGKLTATKKLKDLPEGKIQVQIQLER